MNQRVRDHGLRCVQGYVRETMNKFMNEIISENNNFYEEKKTD